MASRRSRDDAGRQPAILWPHRTICSPDALGSTARGWSSALRRQSGGWAELDADLEPERGRRALQCGEGGADPAGFEAHDRSLAR